MQMQAQSAAFVCIPSGYALCPPPGSTVHVPLANHLLPIICGERPFNFNDHY